MPPRLLLPVALVQGAWVRWTTPRLPPARGRRGRSGEGPAPIRLVGIGDSIVAGVGVEEQRDALVGQFARALHVRSRRAVEWRAHGFNGATSALIAQHALQRVPPADVYLLSAGVNDVTHGVAVRSFARHIGQMLAALKARSPRATIIFAGIPPLAMFPALPWPLGRLLGDRARRLQSAAREILLREQALCFDFPDSLPGGGFARDGFHPATDACAEWAAWLLDLWLGPEPSPPSSPGEASAKPRA
jgi:lysophospholipase L1-like esterase